MKHSSKENLPNRSRSAKTQSVNVPIFTTIIQIVPGKTDVIICHIWKTPVIEGKHISFLKMARKIMPKNAQIFLGYFM